MIKEMKHLPKQWSTTNIAFITLPVGKTQKQDEPNRSIKYIDISGIDNTLNKIREAKCLMLADAPSRARQVVKTGDVLFSTVRPYLRNIAQVSANYDGEIASTGFAVLRPASGMAEKYLFYYCISRDFVNALSGVQYGVSYPAVKVEQVLAQKIDVPPTQEQHRIVAKIEELFSEIDKGVESLETAKTQLQVYRQALLKHAFEGNLTAQWRADNPDKVVPVEQLLKQIKQAREERYQQQLADWQTAVEKWEFGGKEGKKPSKPKKLKSHKPYVEKGLQDFSSFPRQWTHVPLGNVIEDPKYGTSKKCSYESTDFGVLRIPNIDNNKINDSDLKFADFEPREAQEYELEVGDILIIRSNGSISLVGKCAQISSKDTSYLYAGYLIRLRPIFNSILPRYLTHLFSAYILRKQIESKAKSTSGVNNINSGELQSLIVPITSIQEQTEVAKLLDEKISCIEAAEVDIQHALDEAGGLRQSILKKAFSGQLVPQDPTDEPASKLLERIKAEKAEREAQAKANKAKKPRTPRKTKAATP